MMCSKMKFTASNTLGRERKFLDSTSTCGSPDWALSGTGEGVKFVQEDARVGQPEPIDGLLHVPHYGTECLPPSVRASKMTFWTALVSWYSSTITSHKGVLPLLGQGRGLPSWSSTSRRER